jgi:hypothetical protein
MISNAKIQSKGRVVMDLMIAEVKTPKESKDPATISDAADDELEGLDLANVCCLRG